jgi:hypothetical protein
MPLALLLAIALGIPASAGERIPLNGREIQRELALADVARLPAVDVLTSWHEACAQSLSKADRFSQIEKLPYPFGEALACQRAELRRSLTLVLSLQNARDERLSGEKRISELRWVREHYPACWKTGIWPVPGPEPTLADVERLPPLEVVLSWDRRCGEAWDWCHRLSKDDRLSGLIRWYFARYSAELSEVSFMVGHMLTPRAEKIDKHARIQNLRWLRDHYPQYWHTGIWPVEKLLSHFRDNRPKEPRYVPKIDARGEALPAPSKGVSDQN